MTLSEDDIVRRQLHTACSAGHERPLKFGAPFLPPSIGPGLRRPLHYQGNTSLSTHSTSHIDVMSFTAGMWLQKTSFSHSATALLLYVTKLSVLNSRGIPCSCLLRSSFHALPSLCICMSIDRCIHLLVFAKCGFMSCHLTGQRQ
jgi:hypothetical protein